MFNHTYIAARVDRRTYLKGRFRGKFTGKLDRSGSDPRNERYYNIEIMEGEIETRQDDLVPWREYKEPVEFIKETVFSTRLPGRINVTLHCLDGDLKHFRLGLKQIKLKDCHLSGQVYANNEVHGIIEGLISGYVLHHDMLVKEISEEEPPVQLIREEEKPGQKKARGTTSTKDSGIDRVTQLSPRRTSILQILGGLIGLGLVIAVLLIVNNWGLALLGAVGSGVVITWLKRWIYKRYDLRMSRTIVRIAMVLIIIGLVFFTAFHYENYIRSVSGAKHAAIVNTKDLKEKAKDLFDRNQYDEALLAYNQVLEIEANDANSHYQRAVCYGRLGQIAEAVADLKLLISKGDTAAIALNNKINPIKVRQIGIQYRCNDGTISHAEHRKGACSHHGGIKEEEKVYEEYRDY